MASALSAPFFHDETAAYAKLESLLWPHGPVCPRCGGLDRITPVKGGRIGLYRCGPCKRQFTVTIGTIFESSHIKLNLWFQAAHLLCSSKKGMSAHQIHRVLGITYKSAWFVCHRLREAMRDGTMLPLGGDNQVVEADETYIGGKEKNKHANKRARKGRGPVAKEAAFALIERDGRVRSFHLPNVSAKTIKPILHAQIDERSYLMTDEAGVYQKISEKFVGHGTVNHGAKEYVRGAFWHTNTIENYFSILKRGITGTYHHVSQQHLKRYLAEFDFRHNERAALGIDDSARMDSAIRGIVGKRLTYRGSSLAA